MNSTLKNRKSLITAGPTWVAIDKVRVISSISSGATGIAIAQEAKGHGAKVTLFLGPGSAVLSSQPAPAGAARGGPGLPVAGLKIIKFRYFEELQRLLKDELRRRYDIIIHAAAVSDYRPVKSLSGKIGSSARSLTIRMQKTPKLLGVIRKRAARAFVVMFKLEAGRSGPGLINTAYKAMLAAGADMVVANNVEDVSENKHRAYIVDPEKNVIEAGTNRILAKRLLEEIGKRL
ncbi:MAG: hypothetical protein NTV07_01810 [Candidatus Omnitrophica bacterium]|nr:hypothetical protein [Candidatus Omnitrophota bacterium]